jgi:hypothetical protein
MSDEEYRAWFVTSLEAALAIPTDERFYRPYFDMMDWVIKHHSGAGRTLREGYEFDCRSLGKTPTDSHELHSKLGVVDGIDQYYMFHMTGLQRVIDGIPRIAVTVEEGEV